MRNVQINTLYSAVNGRINCCQKLLLLPFSDVCLFIIRPSCLAGAMLLVLLLSVMLLLLLQCRRKQASGPHVPQDQNSFVVVVVDVALMRRALVPQIIVNAKIKLQIGYRPKRQRLKASNSYSCCYPVKLAAGDDRWCRENHFHSWRLAKKPLFLY